MEEAITSIIRYLSIHCQGIDYRHFYVDRANDVDTMLFGMHGVSREKGIYTTFVAETPKMAEAVVRHFRALGMDGDFEEENNNNARGVYCYLISAHTEENL